MKFKKETKIGVLLSTIFVTAMIVNAVFIAGATVGCSSTTTAATPFQQPMTLNGLPIQFDSTVQVDGTEYNKYISEDGDVVLHSYQEQE